jgi:hypothetical protein
MADKIKGPDIRRARYEMRVRRIGATRIENKKKLSTTTTRKQKKISRRKTKASQYRHLPTSIGFLEQRMGREGECMYRGAIPSPNSMNLIRIIWTGV